MLLQTDSRRRITLPPTVGIQAGHPDPVTRQQHAPDLRIVLSGASSVHYFYLFNVGELR